MVFFKEHFLIRQNNESRCTCNHDGFQTFGLRCHSDFLLHCVDKKVQDDTRKHTAVIFDIHIAHNGIAQQRYLPIK